MILALETATELCGVALVHEQRVVASRTVIKNIHSERLMVLVDEVLREAGRSVRALDGIAVSIGPGSFTGLRIGLSAAKGLAYACGLPLLAVPTLDSIAFEVLRSSSLAPESTVLAEREGRTVSSIIYSAVICAAIDAKRDEAYFALYEIAGNDIRCIRRHTIASVTEIVATFPEGKKVLIAGDGAAKLAAACEGSANLVAAREGAVADHTPQNILCSPIAVGMLAERRSAVFTVPDYSELEPVYLRDFVTTLPRVATQTPIP